MAGKKSKASKSRGKDDVVYHLIDINKDIVDAWALEFEGCDQVQVREDLD